MEMSLQSKKEELEKELKTYVGVQIGPEEIGRDLVNEAMIRHWCEAMGDQNPIYTDPEAAKASVHGGLVAPPTMLQAWVLPGIAAAVPSSLPQNKIRGLHQLLTDYGYTSVVATNCEQVYHRYLRPGDQVSMISTIESICKLSTGPSGRGNWPRNGWPSTCDSLPQPEAGWHSHLSRLRTRALYALAKFDNLFNRLSLGTNMVFVAEKE